MTKAYAYIRFSRLTQASGDSENRQFNALESFTQKTGVTIEEVHYDRGKSAFRGDNARTGSFKEILEQIEKNVIRPGDFLVVESIDRITRQRVLDGVELLQNILKRGIHIYTTIDGKTYSYSDPSRDFENLMMIALIAQRANEESSSKSRRLSDVWRDRRNRAEHGDIIIQKGNSIPYGLRVADNKFCIVEEEQEEIRQLFELLLTHGINTAIVKINETSKKKWNNGTLNKLIKNRTVIGCMPKHRVEYDSNGKSKKVLMGYIEGYYPNIIEPELFYRAVDTMSKRKVKNWSGNRTEQDFNIFRHCIFCETCGGKLYYDHRGSRYGEKIYPFFKCDNARTQRHICAAENIRFEYVFGSFLRCMSNLKKITEAFPEGSYWGKKAFPLDHGIDKLLSKPIGKNEELLKLVTQRDKTRIQIDNLNAQIAELNYQVATSMWKRLADLESAFKDFEKAILSAESVNQNALLIEDESSIIDLFKNPEGRSKLNQFFKDNELNFFIAHNKALNRTSIEIRRGDRIEGEKIITNNVVFPKKNILKHWGLPELQEMFGLTVK